MNDTVDQPDDAIDEKRIAVLKLHALQLGEHFDSVQIIVTKFDPQGDRTFKGHRGFGNWYANYGACKEWVQEKEAQLRQNAIMNQE